jgi:peptidoglycan hydrolase CwlO-like protein
MSSKREDCPYCGEKIKKTATKCPRCHSDTSAWAKSNAKRDGCLTIIIIIIVIVVAISNNSDDNKDTTTTTAIEQETNNSNNEEVSELQNEVENVDMEELPLEPSDNEEINEETNEEITVSNTEISEQDTLN